MLLILGHSSSVYWWWGDGVGRSYSVGDLVVRPLVWVVERWVLGRWVGRLYFSTVLSREVNEEENGDDNDNDTDYDHGYNDHNVRRLVLV